MWVAPTGSSLVEMSLVVGVTGGGGGGGALLCSFYHVCVYPSCYSYPLMH